MLNDPANGFNSFCLSLQNVIASPKVTSKSSARKQPGINYDLQRKARLREKLRWKLIALLRKGLVLTIKIKAGSQPSSCGAVYSIIVFILLCCLCFPAPAE